MTTSPSSTRYPEIDSARGVAVVAMVVYHALFDASFFFNYFSWPIWFWRVASLPIASAFLVIAGMSLYVNSQRGATWKKIVGRSMRLLLLAGGITCVTWLLFPSFPVVFGILHLLSVALVLSWPFIKKRETIVVGIVVILLGFLLSTREVTTSSWWLLPVGIMPANWQSLDYYPLLPWWGVMLVGVGLAQRWYPNGQRNKQLSSRLEGVIKTNRVRVLQWLGRRALWLYFIHQPIIFVVLWGLEQL